MARTIDEVQRWKRRMSRAPVSSDNPDVEADPLVAEKQALEQRVRELEAKACSLDVIKKGLDRFEEFCRAH